MVSISVILCYLIVPNIYTKLVLDTCYEPYIRLKCCPLKKCNLINLIFKEETHYGGREADGETEKIVPGSHITMGYGLHSSLRGGVGKKTYGRARGGDEEEKFGTRKERTCQVR